jgi:putative sigma-54 modulation protein
MRIEVKGRNGVVVDDDLRAWIDKRFEKVAKQVSELAELDLELREEKNPSIREKEVAEATLRLKGTTIRAHEAAEDMSHAINLVAEDVARQVKKHRDKRRGRRGDTKPEARPAAP